MSIKVSPPLKQKMCLVFILLHLAIVPDFFFKMFVVEKSVI